MPIMIHYDNQAMVQQVKTEEMIYSVHIRHLDLRKDFVRDYISQKVINVKYICTKNQSTNVLMKALYVPQIKHLINIINLERLD